METKENKKITKKGKIVITLVEDKEKSTDNYFAVNESIGGKDYLFLIKELENLGHKVYLTDWSDYKRKRFSRMFNRAKSKFIKNVKLTPHDLIFLYKQEGFLLKPNTEKFYNMVRELQETGAVIINNPKTVMWNISKEHLFYLKDRNVNVMTPYKVADIIDRAAKGEKFVVKPKIAARGNGLRLIQTEEDINWLKSLNGEKEDYIAQEFYPSIRNGERSLIFVGDEYSHAVLKMPNPNDPNEIRCNKSAGGKVLKYEPTAEEIDYAKNVLQTIARDYSIHISRVDFAISDGKPILVEAELLNPSMFADLIGLGEEFGKKLAGYFNKLVSERTKNENYIQPEPRV